MNAFAIFTAAQQNLDKNPSDENAQFIVDLWNASKNLHTKNTRLQAEVDSLKEELAATNKTNADYARNQDMLDSKLSLAGSEKVPFNAAAFMASMIATAKA